MPIVSRSLVLLASREDLGAGVKTWQVNAVDARNRRWGHGSFKSTQAEAETIRDAVTFDLAGLDKSELLDWVVARNTVATFDYTDRNITESDGEEYIFQWFAESVGNDAITVAWWMDSINNAVFNAIRDRLGYTGPQGADITSRFTFMVSVEPWFEITVEAP